MLNFLAVGLTTKRCSPPACLCHLCGRSLPPSCFARSWWALVGGCDVLFYSLVSTQEDTYFYWSHRAFHKFFYATHKHHHDHTATIALSGGYEQFLHLNADDFDCGFRYMYFSEHVVIVFGLLLPVLLLQPHHYVAWSWFFFRNWSVGFFVRCSRSAQLSPVCLIRETAESHSGYQIPIHLARLIPFHAGTCSDFRTNAEFAFLCCK
jgi:hypothetical protein